MSTYREFLDLRYSTGDVTAVTGIEAGALQHWYARGILTATVQGRGVRRLYSMVDVIRLAVMAKITSFGFSPMDAASVCRDLWHEDGSATDVHGMHSSDHILIMGLDAWFPVAMLDGTSKPFIRYMLAITREKAEFRVEGRVIAAINENADLAALLAGKEVCLVIDLSRIGQAVIAGLGSR